MKIFQEKKSSRVKGLCFHPKKPLLLISHHNGDIKLYDYSLNVFVSTFTEHSGPVRGVDFHITKDIFASGGDDRKIKIWNIKLQKSTFELLGHSDYVRTVQFHRECPWLLSASDDQTARIWNWQSRQCLSSVTGHNHYVMCAQFHPTEDIILTASLDETVRIWNISSLKTSEKKSTFSNTFFETPPELFNSNGVYVMHILEGHTRGINWASFNPTQNLIVTAADDREVKIWRYNESRVWETNYKKDCNNNVSCAIFDPKNPNIVLSNSEDKTLWKWNIITNSSEPLVTLPNSRFWILAAHPFNGIYAAGHDNGFFVFNYHTEFPPCDIFNDSLIYISKQLINEFNVNLKREEPIYSLEDENVELTGVICNRFDNKGKQIILLYKNTTPNFITYKLIKSEKEMFLGEGKSIAFVSRSRIALLTKLQKGSTCYNIILLKNMSNETRKRLILKGINPYQIFSIEVSKILMQDEKQIYIYDLIKGSVICFCDFINKIKRIEFDKKSGNIAIISKCYIHFYDSNLRPLNILKENYNIKGGIWDNLSGAFLYSTQFYLKYSLINGTNGLISSLKKPLLPLILTEKSELFAIDVRGKLRVLPLNRSEINFKKSVGQNDIETALNIAESGAICGEAIFDFLKGENAPELALVLSKDSKKKFSLAVDSGDIEVAAKLAAKCDLKDIWDQLGHVCLKFGAFKIAEKAFLKSGNMKMLSFIYFLNGNMKNVEKIAKFDLNSNNDENFLNFFIRFGNQSDITKDYFEKYSMHQLGLLRAISNKKKDEIEYFSSKIDEEKIQKCKNYLKTIKENNNIQNDQNWQKNLKNDSLVNYDIQFGKSKIAQKERLEKIIEKDLIPLELIQTVEIPQNESQKGIETANNENCENIDKIVEEKNSVEKGNFGGWLEGLSDLKINQPELKQSNETSPTKLNSVEKSEIINLEHFEKMPSNGKSWRTTLFERKNASVADLIVAGDIGLTCEALYQRFGIVHVGPLKPLFLRCRASAQISLNMCPLGPGIGVFVNDENNKPFNPFTQNECEKIIGEAKQNVTKFDLKTAQNLFQNVLLMLPFVNCSSTEDYQICREMLETCVNYILAIRCNFKKEKSSDFAELIKLSYYWTILPLDPLHTFLGLLSAVKTAKEGKFQKTLQTLCRKSLELSLRIELPQQMLPAVKSVEAILNGVSQDEISEDPVDLGLDFRKKFQLRANDLAPVDGSEFFCSYCGAAFSRDVENLKCFVCCLGEVGEVKSVAFVGE